jgi:hypothetical protein
MKLFKALGLVLILSAVVLWPGGIEGQSSLQTSVKLTPITQPDRATTVFSIATSAGADTAYHVTPATYTGVLLVTHGDSVDVKARFFAGYRDNGELQVELEDSLTISSATTTLYQLNIPVARTLWVTFSGGSSNGASTTIDSSYFLTQW